MNKYDMNKYVGSNRYMDLWISKFGGIQPPPGCTSPNGGLRTSAGDCVGKPGVNMGRHGLETWKT